MLVTFKSKASAEIVMYKEHAKRIFDLLEKDPDRGVITAAETTNAIRALEAAIEEAKIHPISEEVLNDVFAHHNDDHDDDQHEVPQIVSFPTRAYPVLEMLKEAQKMNTDVIWGV